MAERRANIPGARTKWLSKDDRTVDPVWLRFLIDIYERTGGGALDKVDLAATGAESANEAAAVALAAAAAAQAIVDDIDRRIDFDFDFDLR